MGSEVEPVETPTAADVDRAGELLGPVIPRTPLHRADRLSALTGLDVWLKREDLTPVRSYKARGAYTVLAGMSGEERSRGVTCASAGNHAQGVAFACARAGVQATIFLPRTTPRQKRDRVAALGGAYVDVVIAGEAYDDAAVAAAHVHQGANAGEVVRTGNEVGLAAMHFGHCSVEGRSLLGMPGEEVKDRHAVQLVEGHAAGLDAVQQISVRVVMLLTHHDCH